MSKNSKYMVLISFKWEKTTRYIGLVLPFLLFSHVSGEDIEVTYYVNPNGNDMNDGLSSSTPFKTIRHALEVAEAGDTIFLMDGVYMEDIKSIKDGYANAPITITGSKHAVVKGSSNKIVKIEHDYIRLEGFTIDGHYKKDGKDYYKKKLIWLENANHVKIINMTIQNAGDECVRLKYFSSNNEIAYNTIRNCGIGKFIYNINEKNKELIYIGTSPTQLYRNPTDELDASNNNWIHHNILTGRGECVDIKEGAMYNVIEYNICSQMDDKDSGTINVRGNSNIIRYNTIFNNIGAGIRLGGNKGYGIDNEVYKNVIHDNTYSIKIMSNPQKLICGNYITDPTRGTYKEYYAPAEPCK